LFFFKPFIKYIIIATTEKTKSAFIKYVLVFLLGAAAVLVVIIENNYIARELGFNICNILCNILK